MSKPDLLVQGMHGMGDNIHQRAVIRQLMQKHTVYLETSWAALYHDLVGPDLKLLRRSVALRTQTKNAIREEQLFTNVRPDKLASSVRIRYGGANVAQTKSKTVLEAMCQTVGVSYADADYRLPVPDAWNGDLFRKLKPLGKDAMEKPWLIVRPLVARTEWRGSMARNAHPENYAELYAMLRPHFFVISVADLVPSREWIVGEELDVDLKFHEGELTFEDLAALFQRADLVLTSSGFAAILAPAVGTPCISVVGGYEGTQCHASGEKWAPMLSLGPEVPCACWSSQCTIPCDKTLDMGKASAEIAQFVPNYVPALCNATISRPMPVSEKPIQFSDKPPAPVPGRATVFAAPPQRGTQAYALWLQQTRRMQRNRGGEKA